MTDRYADETTLVERRARATGTLVALRYRTDDQHWETVCVEHGGVCSHETRRLAEALAVAPRRMVRRLHVRRRHARRDGVVTRPPDMLRFTGGVADGQTVGWTGPWPPPAVMVAVAGSQTGILRIVEPADLDAETWRLIEESPTIQYTRYQLRNASQLPDSFDSDFVFRGADYTPADEG